MEKQTGHTLAEIQTYGSYFSWHTGVKQQLSGTVHYNHT